MICTTQWAVSSGPTLVRRSDATRTYDVVVYVPSGAAYLCGSTSDTTGSGLPLTSGETFTTRLRGSMGDALYVLSTSTDQPVYFYIAGSSST